MSKIATEAEIARLRAEVERLYEQEKRKYRTTVTQEGEITRLRAINAELVEALRPFAEALRGNWSNQPDFMTMTAGPHSLDLRLELTLGHFRDARAAIAKAEKEGARAVMTERVYICFASTGEYSDRTEFALHGYKSEEEAKGFVTRSDALFRKLWAKVLAETEGNRGQHKARCRQFAPGWHPECPTLDVPDYTGYSFWYEAVEIRS